MTRNTIQKEIILSALCQMGNHPTAAMVYEEVHRTHPSISRSTVYRVLGQMAEDGAILHLGLAGSDARFDGNTFQHGHVRCRLCGCVAGPAPRPTLLRAKRPGTRARPGRPRPGVPRGSATPPLNIPKVGDWQLLGLLIWEMGITPSGLKSGSSLRWSQGKS